MKWIFAWMSTSSINYKANLAKMMHDWYVSEIYSKEKFSVFSCWKNIYPGKMLLSRLFFFFLWKILRRKIFCWNKCALETFYSAIVLLSIRILILAAHLWKDLWVENRYLHMNVENSRSQTCFTIILSSRL